MIERSSITIKPDKGHEFERFLKKKAKDQDFWKRNKKDASKPVDKEKLEALFE